ncbi:MAG: hypothetical protein U0232_10405 [Thermomicrobiales bacterium]
MTRIVCLANSWKRGERCIAGIDVATGRWLRPVTDSADGSVPRHVRAVRKGEPGLLDLIDLPLASTGPDFGFECENRLILPGRWYHSGRMKTADLLQYLLPGQPILHTATLYVTVEHMQDLPPDERRTLQLVEVRDFAVRTTDRHHSGDRVWKGRFTTPEGRWLEANITDPVFSARLDAGLIPPAHCLLTISLSLPWRPPDWAGEGEPCWKLIAGVIALDEQHQLSAAELAAIPF